MAMTMFSSLIDEIQDSTVSGLTKRQLRALTRITDLFVAGSGRHSKEQIELFDEIFRTLVAVIELKTRAKLARRLATNPDAPATLVRAFAFDDAIAVAAPVSASRRRSASPILSSTQVPRARIIFTRSRNVKRSAKPSPISSSSAANPTSSTPLRRMPEPAFRRAAFASSSRGPAMMPSLRCTLERGATFPGITS